MKKIVVIGGGLSGLAAANRLCELRESGRFNGQFLLLERGARLGGILQTVERGGFLLELGADAFLSDKPSIINLAHRLGIASEIIPTRDADRRAFIVRDGKLRALPEGFQLIAPSNIENFLASDIVDDGTKREILAEEFVKPSKNAPFDESLASFVRRRFGQNALERIAQPMLAGIYGADPEKLSLRATQSRFLRLEENFGSVIAGLRRKVSEKPSEKSSVQTTQASGARYSLFAGFRRGTQFLLDELAKSVYADEFILNAEVKRLSYQNNLWHIETNSEKFQADGVILAVPAYASAKFLATQFDEIADILANVEYSSCATINFGFEREQIRHNLKGFGFVVPFVEGRSLMAGTFSSVKFEDRAPDEKVLIRAFVGGFLQKDIYELSDEEMLRRVKKDLSELLEIKGEPLFEVIGRWRDSMPQYNVGHLAKELQIKRLLNDLPSLQIASTAFGGVGMPDAVHQGETAAENLAKLLRN